MSAIGNVWDVIGGGGGGRPPRPPNSGFGLDVEPRREDSQQVLGLKSKLRQVTELYRQANNAENDEYLTRLEERIMAQKADLERLRAERRATLSKARELLVDGVEKGGDDVLHAAQQAIALLDNHLPSRASAPRDKAP